MAEHPSTKHPLDKNNEKIGEKSKRRSFFEKSHCTKQEKEKTDALLEEWNLLWGKYDLDYVNVVKYPDEYVQKINKENEMWLEGLEDMNKKANTAKNETFQHIVVEDILTTDQKASLQDIDSQISEHIEKATTFLRDFQVYTRIQENKLHKIERETKMIEKMAIAKK